MNNGLTGAGWERKKRIEAIYGHPKGAAKRVAGSLLRSEWDYRGVRLLGRKTGGGWGARWEWTAVLPAPGRYASAPTRMALMAEVDRFFDSPNDRGETRGPAADTQGGLRPRCL